jgi:hypothetical protein
VFFTPWNTIEVTNERDFNRPDRMWLDPTSKINTHRIYIDPAIIPDSNLDSDTTHEHAWLDDPQAVSVPGLPYMVVMKALHPDSAQLLSDSLGDSESNDSINSPDVIYTGTVSGTLRTTVVNDLGDVVVFPLTGLEIRLMEQDALWWTNIGNAITDGSGNFTINYSTNQHFEGGEIELFLNVMARNPVVDVVARNGGYSGLNVISQSINLGQFTPAQGPGAIGIVTINNEAHKAVHYVMNAFEFVAISGVPIAGNLDIYPFGSNTSHFLPISPSLSPGIFLQTGTGHDEDTPYHEFGHFAMFRYQGNQILTPVAAKNNCSHGWAQENTSVLAWMEGWADMFEMVLDAYWRNEDNEYGGDGTNPNYEFRRPFDDFGTSLININNGIASEYFIACAMYDLWDGPGKGLPAILPSPVNSPTLFSGHGFRDRWSVSPGNAAIGIQWESEDDVEFDFSQIVAPLMQSGPLIGNIWGYYDRFLGSAAGANCELRADISRLFRENKVLLDIDLYNDGFGIPCMASDALEETISGNYSGYICQTGIPSNYTDDYTINYFASSATSTTREMFSWSGNSPYITDDLILGYYDGTSHFFDLSLNSTFQSEPTSPFSLNAVNGSLSTCGGVDIYLQNADLQLGGGVTTMDLSINDGSEFKIGINGKLIINDNSRLFIAAGATLVIRQGAEIVLNGNNAILEIDGTLVIEDYATFTFTGDGHVVWGNPSYSGQIVAGIDAGISFEGSGSNDLVFQIKHNRSFKPDSGLDFLTLKNGKIEIGEDGVLNTQTADLIMEDLSVTAIDPNRPFKWIQVNGQNNHTIDDIDVSFGTFGIRAFQMWGNGALFRMYHSTIHDCGIGLQVHSKGARLEFCDFEDNTTGVEHQMSSMGSVYIQCKMTDNFYGISHTSGLGNLLLDQCNVDNNDVGAVFSGAGLLRGKCTSISDNVSDGLRFTSGATVDLSDRFDAAGSQFTIQQNARSLVAWNSTGLDLYDGRNVLQPVTESANKVVYGTFVGTLCPGSGNLIQAQRRNYWGTAGTAPAGRIPIFGTDYYTWMIGTSSSICNFEFTDGSLHTPSSSCSYGNSNGGDGNLVLNDPLFDCDECEIINSTHFTSKQLNEAVLTAMLSMEEMDSTGSDSLALLLFHEILTYPIESPDESEKYLLDLAYRYFIQSFAHSVTTGKISNDPAAHVPEMQDGLALAISVFDDFISNTTEPRLLHRILVDKANVLRSVGFSSAALTELDEAEPYLISEQVDFHTYAECYYELERQLLAEEIDLESFIDASDLCMVSLSFFYSNMFPAKYAAEPESITGEIESMLLYPNPATNTLHVSIPVEESVIKDLVVMDAQGKIALQKFPPSDPAKSRMELDMNIESLSAGLYFIRVRTSKRYFLEKFVVR